MALAQGMSKITNITMAIALFAGLIAPLINTQEALASGEAFSSVTNKTTRPGVASSLSDLQVESVSNNEIVIIVRATSGELEIDDSLVDVTGWGERLVIRGSRDNLNDALQTLTLTSDNLGAATVTATLGDTVDGHLLVVDPDTGHGYMIVDDLYDEDTNELTNHKLTWPDAKEAAELYQYQGASGYLATITSSTENDFISFNLDNNGWIGANDNSVEGEWKWVSGPETGQQFWQSTDYNGDNQPLNGHAVNDMFNYWNSGEPNNQDTENCAEFIAGDGWNDLPCESHTNGYVIEFGDENHSLTPLASTSFTVTVEGDVVNVSDCDELLALDSGNRHDTINLTNDIDCSGYDVEPLVDGETFKGTLNGNNHKIYNVEIDLPNDYRVGLFARLEGATIHDLQLDNFNIIASEYVG
ncbi:hypothetical protein KDA11_06160, partial [Candidatus Saccharibacteria bacterium]|nr:hypothetical protein [Candidatus Saccharibacteria bacterium]